MYLESTCYRARSFQVEPTVFACIDKKQKKDKQVVLLEKLRIPKLYCS